VTGDRGAGIAWVVSSDRGIAMIVVKPIALVRCTNGGSSIIITGWIGSVVAFAELADHRYRPPEMSWLCSDMRKAARSAGPMPVPRNRSAENPISILASRFSVQVLPAQEDTQIARHAWELVTSTSSRVRSARGGRDGDGAGSP